MAGERPECRRLGDLELLSAWEDFRAGTGLGELAERYGVCENTLWRNWRRLGLRGPGGGRSGPKGGGGTGPGIKDNQPYALLIRHWMR